MNLDQAKRDSRSFYFNSILFVLIVLILAALIVPLVAWIDQVHWVGSRDVEFEFLVVDAATGESIDQVVVHLFVDYEGKNAEEVKNAVKLRTASDGRATVVKNCTSSGTSSYWKHTLNVNVSKWGFFVTADGYRSSELDYLAHHRTKVRHEDQRSHLPVRIELQKR